MYKFTTEVNHSEILEGYDDPDKSRWFIVCKTVNRITPDHHRAGLFKLFVTKPTPKQVRATKRNFRGILKTF